MTKAVYPVNERLVRHYRSSAIFMPYFSIFKYRIILIGAGWELFNPDPLKIIDIIFNFAVQQMISCYEINCIKL